MDCGGMVPPSREADPAAMSTSRRRLRPARQLSLTVGLAALLAMTASSVSAAEAPQRHEAAERLGLRLLNCTRTGGWVRADGSCRGYRSGRFSARLPALRLHETLSRRVAFRWSAEMVSEQVCAHSIEGRPDLGRRFSSAGFGHHTYGENIGCGWGGTSARDMVIRTHLAMQAEKRDGGGHWRNMKNRSYRSVGIGVASMGGWTAIAYDFYGG
jgi:hypothetical protein